MNNRMGEIRIGAAGLGDRGLEWIRFLQRIKGCRIKAICDRIKALQESALLQMDNGDEVTAYTDYEELARASLR